MKDVKCTSGQDGAGGICNCSASRFWDQGQWQPAPCYEGVCYMEQPYNDCNGITNKNPLGDGTWCYEGKRHAKCPTGTGNFI